MSRRKPTKPCATCGHGKGMHRVGYCRHQWTTTGQTFMGVGTVVKYCTCGGYAEEVGR